MSVKTRAKYRFLFFLTSSNNFGLAHSFTAGERCVYAHSEMCDVALPRGTSDNRTCRMHKGINPTATALRGCSLNKIEISCLSRQVVFFSNSVFVPSLKPNSHLTSRIV